MSETEDRIPADVARVFDLENHGPDVWVGESPQYPWGRIYGGLVIAQALWAATQTVVPEHALHSMHTTGGRVELAQRYGYQRNNSDFLIPNPQSTTQLALRFSQPLLRGSGKFYNSSLIVLAEIDKAVAIPRS